jgi:hypothetical protein
MTDQHAVASLRPPVVSTEVLTDEQCQRILALRAARAVLETKQAASPLSSAAVDFKNDMLLLVAEWIMTGDLRPMIELQQDVESHTNRQAALDALADL